MPQAALEGLNQYQDEVDGAADYAARVATAKSAFSNRNRRTNAIFRDVRAALAKMAGDAVRCAYCEDSAADEVEHVKPKDLYPQSVFRWPNYVYACGPCNGRKRNKFSVIDAGGTMVDITRARGAPVVAPVEGLPALIDPRSEDPMQFFDMDLQGTFVVLEALDLNPVDEARATFTIELLGLNRDLLLTTRRDAYLGYRARLSEYSARAEQGAEEAELDAIRSSLLRSPHPTVWEEMKRQAHLIEELRMLFAAVPAAIEWRHFPNAFAY
ncbi:retron system putative HNH endonuclease [Stappia sp.]|uniref:retron system putative HNH endonuclease n=1 Tax=Stappia sp. TaxID=1870903 RepID=UPI0032D90076